MLTIPMFLKYDQLHFNSSSSISGKHANQCAGCLTGMISGSEVSDNHREIHVLFLNLVDISAKASVSTTIVIFWHATCRTVWSRKKLK